MDQSDSQKTEVSAASEGPFSRFFADSPSPMFVYDQESLRFVSVNEATVRLYGYTRDELLGMTIADIRPPEDVPAMLKVVSSTDPRTIRQGEWRHRRKDGSVLDVEITSHSIVHAGRPARFVVVQDVTERTRAEEGVRILFDQIRKERQRLDNLLERVPAIVWEFWNEPDESRQRINYVSAFAEGLLGYPPAVWLDPDGFWVTLVHPDDRERAQREAWDSYNSGNGGVSQFRCIASDGRVVWIEATSVVIYDEDGSKAGVRGVNIDITARKLAEQALRESEERYSLVERATNDIIWDWDLLTGKLHHSNAVTTVLGYPPGSASLDGRWWFEGTHPDDREQIVEQVWQTVNGGGSYWSGEYRFRRGDGTWASILDRSYIMRDSQGRAIRMIGSMVDMSERTRAEQALRFLVEASETLATSLDYSTTLDNLTRIAVPFLADCCTIHTVDDADAIHITSFAHIDPDKERALKELARSAVTPPHVPHPVRAVLESGVPLIRPQITDADVAAAEANDSLRDAWHIVNPLSAISVPLRARGRVFGVISFMASESERIFTESDRELATELARRASVAVDNARLYQKVQLADTAKNEFLAMLGHELRNPLAAISNAGELIRLHGNADPSLQRTLEVVERQTHHMARLVDDLLDVSRITQGKIELRRENIDIRPIVSQAVQTAQPLINARRHVIDVRMPELPLYVWADPVRMAQVLSNLLSNAAKYTEPGGRIAVTVDGEGPECIVRVQDTGVGISADMLENVFDLFAQGDRALDRDQRGLGIGLTVAKNLVQLHGGSVTARSEGIGKGAEFVIRLPVQGSPPADQPQPAKPGRSTGSARRRILLVEDNLDVARTLAEILELWGYEVQLAHDGQAALALARTSDADVVLMDIGLQGIDGYEVARSLRENHLLPKATLVALTGYGQEDDQRRSREAGFRHHLVKPVDFNALEKLLAAIGVRD
ncbi:MAG TPA: PAS domain-containing protein [Armatimonadota bacterium]|jgi:PAS domain S-box-containing protein